MVVSACHSREECVGPHRMYSFSIRSGAVSRQQHIACTHTTCAHAHSFTHFQHNAAKCQQRKLSIILYIRCSHYETNKNLVRIPKRTNLTHFLLEWNSVNQSTHAQTHTHTHTHNYQYILLPSLLSSLLDSSASLFPQPSKDSCLLLCLGRLL